jgi:hypothetical protein
MNDPERELWRVNDTCCLMVTCCAGAELQVRVGDAVVLRELYPLKTDLYERARDLEAEYRSRATAR